MGTLLTLGTSSLLTLMFARILTVLVLLIVLGYGIREAIPLFRGPVLSINTIENSGNSDDGFITISGSAIHTQAVVLDGNPVVTDQDGRFMTTLTLPRGGAILTVTATDRFRRTVTERRTVFVR